MKTPVSLLSKKILVVDDDPNVTELVRLFLDERTWRIIGVDDGLRALEILKKEPVDLILLDMRMPFFSGLWFCNAFKDRPTWHDMPVIVMSSVANEEEIKKAYEIGARDYLKKPFGAEELLHAVEKNLV